MQILFRHLVLIAVLVLFTASTATAQAEQGKSSVKVEMDRELIKYQKELGITAEQQEQLRDLQTTMKARREELRTADLTQEERRAAAKEIQADKQAAMNHILTTEQWAKYQELRAQDRAERPRGVHRMERDDASKTKGGLKERLEEAKQTLNLTPDQEQQLEQLWAATQTKMQEMRTMRFDTDEAKKAHRQQIMQEQRTALMSILTPAQQKQLKEMKREQRSNKRAPRQ